MVVRALLIDEVDIYRSVRLLALRSDPDAFGSTHERERAFGDDTWRRRLAGFEDRPGRIFVADAPELGDDDRATDAGIVGLVGLVGVVGMVGVGLTERRERAMLWGLWVDPVVRGRGVGRDLVDAALDWSRTNGATSVTLWVGRSNVAARRLYEQCGFDVDDEAGTAPDGCSDELHLTVAL